ncbi:MAG: hypothetical protein RL621_1180 [Bacteroidota bacterium]|jgi:hypothetical protein
MKMKAQHKFKTNQLGLTYSEWGTNLDYQLKLNYVKLYGKQAVTTRKSINGQSGGNRQNATRV